MARQTRDHAAAPMEIVVEERIAASPAHLYELVSDVTNMGRWSPETTACRWVKGATAPQVGARFRGANRDGWRRWSTLCAVSEADPGRRFAFEVTFLRLPVARWSYDFEPDGDGTRVVETWQDRRLPRLKGFSAVLMGVPDRPGHNRESMEQTLAHLRDAAEAMAPS